MGDELKPDAEEAFFELHPEVPRDGFNHLLAAVYDAGYSWSEFRTWPDDCEEVALFREAVEIKQRAEAALTETTAAYLRQQKQGLTREAAVRLTLLEGKVAVLRRILGRGNEG